MNDREWHPVAIVFFLLFMFVFLPALGSLAIGFGWQLVILASIMVVLGAVTEWLR